MASDGQNPGKSGRYDIEQKAIELAPVERRRVLDIGELPPRPPKPEPPKPATPAPRDYDLLRQLMASQPDMLVRDPARYMQAMQSLGGAGNQQQQLNPYQQGLGNQTMQGAAEQQNMLANALYGMAVIYPEQAARIVQDDPRVVDRLRGTARNNAERSLLEWLARKAGRR